MLPDYAVLDRKLETLDEKQVRALQLERLKKQVRHCYENTSFWRIKFDQVGLNPSEIQTLDDLSNVPFCTKTELQQDQEMHGPFGSYIGVDPSQWARYFTTSGTTGRPVVRILSRRDWSYILKRFQREAFLKPGDIAVILGPTDGLLGPTAVLEGWQAMGAIVVRLARATTEEKIKTIIRLKPKMVSGTASFLLYLADAAQSIGLPFSTNPPVRLLHSVGEPGAAIPATRQRMLTTWGAEAVIDGFGMTELFPLGDSCPACSDAHLANDFVIVEVVDPESGMPVKPGKKGELVYTNIIGDSMPLLRYRSRDIGTLRPFDPCPCCGSTATRIADGIQGRVDQMLWYKGINIFPSAIEGAVRNFSELSNEFEIVVDQEGATQSLKIRVEVLKQYTGDRNDLGKRLLEKLREALEGVHPALELVDEGTFPKTEYKGSRIRDLRNKKT